MSERAKRGDHVLFTGALAPKAGLVAHRVRSVDHEGSLYARTVCGRSSGDDDEYSTQRPKGVQLCKVCHDRLPKDIRMMDQESVDQPYGMPESAPPEARERKSGAANKSLHIDMVKVQGSAAEQKAYKEATDPVANESAARERPNKEKLDNISAIVEKCEAEGRPINDRTDLEVIVLLSKVGLVPKDLKDLEKLLKATPEKIGPDLMGSLKSIPHEGTPHVGSFTPPTASADPGPATFDGPEPTDCAVQGKVLDVIRLETTGLIIPKGKHECPLFPQNLYPACRRNGVTCPHFVEMKVVGPLSAVKVVCSQQRY